MNVVFVQDAGSVSLCIIFLYKMLEVFLSSGLFLLHLEVCCVNVICMNIGSHILYDYVT